jgi:hypothetical protein
MFDRLINYFRQKFGNDSHAREKNANNQPDTSARTSSEYAREKTRQVSFHKSRVMDSVVTRVYEQLRAAITLFTNGYREDTIQFFEAILKNPAADATVKTVASCLLGETFRGMGDFGKAQQHYELTIRESDTIPDAMQVLNEYVRHYRPRAFCGLLTVYRRTLFDDHEKIKSLINEIKSDFNLFPIEDLPAQVSLMEGLYLRQISEVPSSISCIAEGLDSVRKADTPYFLFLQPEHFEALLLISHLCESGNDFHVRKISREILKANRGPWSLAFAGAAQLHLHLRQAANGEFTNFNSNEFGQESQKVNELIGVFQKNAQFENDPLLLTECAMLSLIWYLLVEDTQQARNELHKLKKLLPISSQPLILLRAVELGALRMELNLAGLMQGSDLDVVFDLGRKAFEVLSNPLKTYKCSEEQCQFWKGLLTNEAIDSRFVLETWASEEIRALRSRVWP